MAKSALCSSVLFRAAVLGVLACASIPMSVAAQEEARVGTFVELWTDPPPTSSLAPTLDYFLVDDEGRWLALVVDGSQLPAPRDGASLVGRRVTVTGILETGPAAGPTRLSSHSRLRVTTIGVLEEGVGARRGSLGEDLPQVRRYVTVLCRFPGSVDESPRTPSMYRSWLGSDPPGMGHFWKELSRGRLDFHGEVVVGWYDLPSPIAHYFEDPEPGERVKPDWGLLARDCAALADGEVDFTSVDGVNLQFNLNFGAAWGGSSTLTLDGDPRLFGVTWMPAWSSQSVYGHEIGHTFGLPHSSGPYGQTYDSRWDVMSNGNTLWDSQLETGIGQHTIGFHRDLLGWVPPGRKLVANRLGATETVALEFWDQAGGSGWDMVEIPLWDGTFYTVEARRQEGYDEGIPFRAVILHHVDPERGDRRAQVVDPDGNGDPNDAGAAWTPGETFRDPGLGVHLDVIRELEGVPGVDDGFLVAVSRGWWLDLTIEGQGRVWGSKAEVDCATSCSKLLPSPATVSLHAEGAEGLAFAGWGGACSGAGSCQVRLTGWDEVTADFVEPLAISSTEERPSGVVGAWYQDVLEATGGTGTYSWSVSDGALPKGLSLEPASGRVEGIAEESGRFRFTATAVSKALTATATFDLSVGTPSLKRQDVIDELLKGGTTLTRDETRYLDIVGNANGRFDLGDVFLFLKRSGG